MLNLTLKKKKVKCTKGPEENAHSRERDNVHDTERAHNINRRLIKNPIGKK